MPIDDYNRITLSDTTRKLIRERIKRGFAFAEEIAKCEDADSKKFTTIADRNRALARGDYERKRGQKSNRTVNHIARASIVKGQIVCGGATEFTLSARKSQFVSLVEEAQPILNSTWDSLAFDDVCKATFYDSMIYNQGGVVEIGWRYEEPERIDEEDLQAEPEAEPVMVGDQMIAPSPDLGDYSLPPTEYVSDDEAQAAATQPEQEPVQDDPFIERFPAVDPWDMKPNFVVDPACTSFTLEGARWVFRRKREALENVKRNNRYRNTGGLKGTAEGYWRKPDEFAQPKDGVASDVMEVVLWDGYTILRRNGRDELIHVVFADEADKELLAEPTPYPHWQRNGFTNPFPFEVMPANVFDNDTIDGVPDVSLARDKQVSFNEAWTTTEYRRAHSPNVLAAPTGTFDGDDGKETQRRIESGVEHVVVEFDPQTGGAPTWLQRPPVSQDDYKVLAEAPREIMDIFGISDFQANQLAEKQMTATEAQQLAGQGGTRQDKEIEMYHGFLTRVGYKVLVLLQQCVTERQHAVPGEPDKFGTATPEALRGVRPGTKTSDNPLGELYEPGIQFRLAIDPGKKAPKNRFADRQQLTELVGKLAPFAQADPKMAKLLSVALDALATTYDLPELDEANKEGEAGSDGQPAQQHDPERDQAAAVIVKLHASLQQMEQALAAKDQEIEQAKAVKRPSEALSYDALPISGKIQMAAQAGITLTEADFVEHMTLQELQAQNAQRAKLAQGQANANPATEPVQGANG